MNWFRKLLANLRAAQDRANQERWDREQKRRRASLDEQQQYEQMKADMLAAWGHRQMKQNLRGYDAMTDKWQPIATAPKDGTWVICWNPDWPNCKCVSMYWSVSAWTTGDEDGNPTHWQPFLEGP